MSTTVSIILLAALSWLLTLGNYWHTFGLWPKSWIAFFGFAIAQYLVAELIRMIIKEEMR